VQPDPFGARFEHIGASFFARNDCLQQRFAHFVDVDNGNLCVNKEGLSKLRAFE
jgi:hypothetical protein